MIEDVCESHGATFEGKKAGTFGLMSNFSFYYAHHMSTIEGGIMSVLPDRLRIDPALVRDWQERWQAKVFRHQGESRMVFACKTCDFEFTYVAEAPVGEVELPFEELTCPFCDG